MFNTKMLIFFKEDMITLFKLVFKIILTVQVFHWMLAEADLFLPGVKEFAVGKLQTYQIPTHDLLLTEGVLSFGEVGQKMDQMLAGLSESPFKMEIPSALLGSSQMKFQDLKHLALNQLPVNPVKVFESQELTNALRTTTANPWQEF